MNRILAMIVGVVFLLLAVSIFLFARNPKPSRLLGLSAESAMTAAQKTGEAKAFLAMDNGRFNACLSRRVVRPCDSEWVTCIDDAWVVEFAAEKACNVVHDGRLSLRILIGKEGNIISRFPEKEYFADPQYCMESYDCLSVIDEIGADCRNFIYGQMDAGIKKGEGSCECRHQKCAFTK